MSQGSIVSTAVVGTSFAGAQVPYEIVTHGNDQYVGYFDVNRDLIIKHRTIGAGADGAWDSTKILYEKYYDTNGTGTYQDSWDSHRWVALGVDGSGNLHVCADHHNNEIRYWRTSTPGNLGTLTRETTLVGVNKEDSVTYPTFINASGGNMKYLVFRDGGSGNGVSRAYVWNNNTKTWSMASTFFDNNAPYGDGTVGPYSEIFAPGDGWFHIVYCWRGDSGPSSSTRLSYVRTQDFVTFENIKGQVPNVPMSAASTYPLIDQIPNGSPGFYNGEWKFLIHAGATWIAYVKNNNIWVARGDANGWQLSQMTTTGDVSNLGNGYIENYLIPIDADTIAVDWLLDKNGREQKRIVFDVATWNTAGPYTPGPLPESYYPAGCYQTAVDDIGNDSVTGRPRVVTARNKADSKSGNQTNGLATRNILHSRPYAGRIYVLSWLLGPEVFTRAEAAGTSDAEAAAMPARTIYLHRVDY